MGTMSAVIRKCTDRFFETELDGEVVLMNANSGSFHALKGTGLAIWRLMDEASDADRLVGLLCERYAIDEATCRKDVDLFLARLVEAGFVERG